MNLGDPQRFAAAYAEYAPHAARAASAVLVPAGRRTDVEDVVHDVFAGIWRRPEQFDANRGPFGAYVRMIARSRALDLCRTGAAGVRAHDRLSDAATRTLPVDAVVTAVERQELRLVLLRALTTLPPAQRDAIMQACWGDLTAREIADQMGVPLGTVKGRIRLGMARLRAEFEANEMTAASVMSAIATLL